MKQHVLIVSQYYYPEPFRINDMAAEWVRRGYRVTVLTGIPNYPQGRFYKGYGWFKGRKETRDGVEIIRIPLVARGKHSLGLVLNYLSFVVSGWFWKTFTRVKADLVFTFEVSPMTQALVGVWYAKKHKIPHYLYVQDLWPENVQIVTGITSPLVIGPISRMVTYIYRHCDKIFATSPSFVEAIRARLTEDREKVSYRPQYAESFYAPTEDRSPLIPGDGVLNITFTGNIGSAQGLDILPEAARLLAERHVSVRFNVVGDGRHKQKLIDSIRAGGVEDSFHLIGWQKATDIPAILAASDAAFVSFADNELYAMTIPAKLQSYMACGVPILASARGETKRIVEEAGCGFVADIGGAEALADVIVRFAALSKEERRVMGQRAEAYCAAHFNKDKLHDEMLKQMDNR